jgi:hypothetical protein
MSESWVTTTLPIYFETILGLFLLIGPQPSYPLRGVPKLQYNLRERISGPMAEAHWHFLPMGQVYQVISRPPPPYVAKNQEKTLASRRTLLCVPRFFYIY